jgi:hypothetical protein
MNIAEVGILFYLYMNKHYLAKSILLEVDLYIKEDYLINIENMKSKTNELIYSICYRVYSITGYDYFYLDNIRYVRNILEESIINRNQ